MLSTYVGFDKLGTTETICSNCNLEMVLLLTDKGRVSLGMYESFISADSVLESGAEGEDGLNLKLLR